MSIKPFSTGVILIIVLFCLSGISGCSDSDASETIYYVSPSGDNSNTGTSPGDAWETLQYAVDAIGPGDTIIVLEGEYVGCRIEQSGTASNWITLRSELGASVIVSAPGPNNVHSSNIEVETWSGNGTVSYWTIEGFEVRNAPNWGIDLRGNEDYFTHHIAIRANIVHNNGVSSVKTGIFCAFVEYVTIEHNESYANGEHGIYHSNSGDYPTIQSNILHHNGRCGIHMNGDLSMGNDGVISNALVAGNIIYENGISGGAGINMDGVRDSIIRNNLLYENHAGGITLYQIDGGLCSQNNRVLNNTIIMAADGRWGIHISASDCINNQLINNIIYNYHSWRGSIELPTPTLPGFVSDYNAVMDRMSTDGGNSVISLAAWQALGYGANSLLATPAELFVNSGSDDYHLKEGGPAIDTGTWLNDVPDDLEGTTRPQGSAYDRGAYEFSSQMVPSLGLSSLILLGCGLSLYLGKTKRGESRSSRISRQ